jgi:hypothetical protein
LLHQQEADDDEEGEDGDGQHAGLHPGQVGPLTLCCGAGLLCPHVVTK